MKRKWRKVRKDKGGKEWNRIEMEKGGRKRIEKEETAEKSGQKKRNATKREEAGTGERRES